MLSKVVVVIPMGFRNDIGGSYNKEVFEHATASNNERGELVIFSKDANVPPLAVFKEWSYWKIEK